MNNKQPETDSFSEPVPVRSALRLWKTTLAREMVMADSTGAELTGEGALIRALILRRIFRRDVLAPEEKTVGLLLPPSVPAVLANFALTMDRRIAVNLNYTVNSEIMNICIRKAGVRHLITSRKVMERFDFHPECDVVYMEDFPAKIGLADKLTSALTAKFLPLGALCRRLGVDKIDPDETMAILFTSGSTGNPKGVMLSHRNLSGNIESCRKFFHLDAHDRMVGVLPIFHSMGYMATVWACFSIGMRPFYHYTPLEHRTIAKMCRKYKPTILLGTPSFLRLYAKKFDPADMASVNLVMSGAERCPVPLMDEYEKLFGIRPVQGYGITETAPVLAASISRQRLRPGDPEPNDTALGAPLPGISVEIRDPESGAPLKIGQTGLIWVSGVNIMKGYCGEPEKTAEVLRDGWYNTGDLGRMDKNGYLYMAGRLSRFAKVGGEMVPHEGIEEALNEVLGHGAEEAPTVCVTSVPDERKGEKIVVLYTELPLTPEKIASELTKRKFPALWIPGKDAYVKIDAIPLLGTGKLDLHAMHERALQAFAGPT